MNKDVKINTEEMAQAGVNFGHKVSSLHPKMKPYVSGIKNNVNIFDLEKTAKEFEKALKFISALIQDGKTILFVGTKIQMRAIVKAAAEECAMPYVVERWLGGTFTNLETILKRVEYFKDLEKKKATGELEKYTKKERINFDREMEKLRVKFEGIKNMAKLPEAVLLLDLKKDEICARESKRKGVKIIAIADTNVNPDIADYLIPANDDAISSVKYILEKVKECIINARKIKN
ncbi:MAG: 30S ribosomal protein S2 [Patescibacteria group bacterium]